MAGSVEKSRSKAKRSAGTHRIREGKLLSNLIRLYKSLGGDWESLEPQSDHVEDSVGEAAERGATDARMRFGVGLGVALNARQGDVHRPKEGFAQSWQPFLVPRERIDEICLGPGPKGDRQRR